MSELSDDAGYRILEVVVASGDSFCHEIRYAPISGACRLRLLQFSVRVILVVTSKPRGVQHNA